MVAQPQQRSALDDSHAFAFESRTDDYEPSKERARQLLQYVLPKNSWLELETTGILSIRGIRASYVISPDSQTEIRDPESGRRTAYACLQLSIPAPTYDRLVAEYLLIKNAEDEYWKTANIFRRSGNGNDYQAYLYFCLGAFGLALFVKLLLDVIA